MKTITLTIFFSIIFICCSWSQHCRAIFFNSNVYRTRVDLQAIRLTNTNKKIDTVYNEPFVIRATHTKNNGKIREFLDYKIISEDESGYMIIRVLPKVELAKEKVHPDSTRMINVVRYKEGDQEVGDSTNAYNYYFAIRKDAFKPLGKTLLSEKIIGVPLVHPFKLRPDRAGVGWNLGLEFTVSYSFGVRFKLGKSPFQQNFFTIIPVGFGLGASKYFRQNADSTLTEKEDAVAITYYQAGLMFTVYRVNIGIFVGLDAMIDHRKDWVYQSQPWISFGLGYKFKKD